MRVARTAGAARPLVIEDVPKVASVEGAHVRTLSIFGHTIAVKSWLFSRLLEDAHLRVYGVNIFGVSIFKSDEERCGGRTGEPVDRRDGIMNNAVVGDIYKYASPVPGFATIELNISRANKKLVAAYFYYAGIVPWKTVEGKLGKNFKKEKGPNGRPIYLYQFQGRIVSVMVDSANNICNIGTW